MTERDFENDREKLLTAALTHVPFDGWTEAGLAAGARDLGLEPDFVRRAFPRGAIDAIDLFNAVADRRMIEELERRDPASMRTRDRVAAAVRIRLEQAEEHREAVRRALPALLGPVHAARAARFVWRTVDAIWYAAGDRSTDHNYYTKRSLLAGVYGATVLYWLNDRSEDHAGTWAFLDRRLDEVMRLPGAMARIAKPLQRVPTPFSVLRALRSRRRPRFGWE